MNSAYLLIGGNLGNRESNLSKTCGYIEANCGRILRRSMIYETAAWGKTDQPDFLNQAIDLHTALSPFSLLESLLDIELKLGRQRGEKFGPRIIDIDILLYNDEIIREKDLVIPHPQMAQRRFVLVPLADIAGDKMHPVLGISISEMLKQCPDPLAVNKKSGGV